MSLLIIYSGQKAKKICYFNHFPIFNFVKESKGMEKSCGVHETPYDWQTRW